MGAVCVPVVSAILGILLRCTPLGRRSNQVPRISNTRSTAGLCQCCVSHPPPPPALHAEDPDQPARPRLRAGLSTLQRSSAAAAATAAVGSSSSFTSTPAQGAAAGTSPTQLPPAAARPGAAVQMTAVQTSPLPGAMHLLTAGLCCHQLSTLSRLPGFRPFVPFVPLPVSAAGI
jgi:hypothetical protein